MKNEIKNHEYLVRASSIGDLMTKGRSKDSDWGDTSLAVIRKAVLFNKYGIEEYLTSKHMEKGILNEEEGLKMYRQVMNGNFPIDDVKQRLINNYVSGEPDLIHDGIIVDVKNSWSANSFPFWDQEIKNKAYIYQLQCYLWLSGLKEAKLVYTLTTTPEHIRKQEIQRLFFRLVDKPQNKNLNQSEIEDLAESIVNKEMIFDQIPIENRVKIFDVKRDEKIIESIQQRIEDARIKYDELYSLI